MSEKNSLDSTVISVFETLYVRHRLTGKSARSVKQFKVNLKHLDRCLGRPALLSDLTDDVLLDAMQMILNNGRAIQTANKFRSHVIAIWNFCARKGLCKTFPDVRPLKSPERLPQAWSRDQLQRLFVGLAQAKGEIGHLPASEWWICAHLFFWETAERLTALLTLRVDDIDLQSGWVRVRAENRKGCTRDRAYLLHPDTLARIRAFIELDPTREYVFHIHFIPQMLYYHYRKILKGLGLPHGRDSMMHRMRKTSLSHFKAAGGDATRLADHANAATTIRSYLDPTIVIEQQASGSLFRPDAKDSDPPRAA